jgi:hypothetical protein
MVRILPVFFDERVENVDDARRPRLARVPRH